MDQNLDSKLQIKSKLLNFYNSNKVKIFIFIFVILLILISIIFLKYNNNRNNILISEKYVQAGLNLSSNEKDNAKILYEEIILKKNKFYSILALNTIIEKDLINDSVKILNYFKILENLNYSEEKQDLIIFKKALYFLKISNNVEGNRLLNNLIKKNSKYKLLAEEAIAN
tara:strand:+ start:2790 stop:3299 length:510 start_codon:yes stop_codon:yes gene_type:complete